MAYTPTVWINKQAPPLNAANLNKIEKGIEDAHTGLTNHDLEFNHAGIFHDNRPVLDNLTEANGHLFYDGKEISLDPITENISNQITPVNQFVFLSSSRFRPASLSVKLNGLSQSEGISEDYTIILDNGEGVGFQMSNEMPLVPSDKLIISYFKL